MVTHSFDETYKEKEEFFGHPYKELQEYFKGLPRGSVLDLGCGQGRDAIFLSSIGFKVTAADNSEVGVKQMVKKDPKIRGIVTDVLELTLQETFDIILLDMLIHTLEPTQQKILLKKCFEHLTEKGLLCIVYPEDTKKSHLTNILKSISKSWNIETNIEIKDTPKISEEDENYLFYMMVIRT